MDLFVQYIAERHTIYKKRFLRKEPFPWTDDPILRKFKFTNVFRFLDPGTKYVIEKIIPNCRSLTQTIFNLIIYRLYNKIETFEKLGIQTIEDFNRETFDSSLRELKASGVPVFTNAFTVAGYNWINASDDKIGNTSSLIAFFHKDIADITQAISSKATNRSENTYKVLLSLNGLGKFLAYQIAVDIGYWNLALFDEGSFVVAGPGCRRGIDRVYSSRNGLSYEECIRLTADNQDQFFQRRNIDLDSLFDDQKVPRLNLMAMENCFCEISKYLRAYYDEGRPRIIFHPNDHESRAPVLEKWLQ